MSQPDSVEITDLIRQAPELMRNAAALLAALKVPQFLKSLFGGATDAVAQQLAVEVQNWCLMRQLRLFAKTQKLLNDAGLKANAVPPKILFPLLEGASIEEDEHLHDMWAALLANAASPENADKVRPGFIAILKQMAPDEACFLNEIYNERSHANPIDLVFQGAGKIMDKLTLLGGSRSANETTEICIDSLQSLRLIVQVGAATSGFKFKIGKLNYAMTRRGIAFLEACQPPKPKS